MSAGTTVAAPSVLRWPPEAGIIQWQAEVPDLEGNLMAYGIDAPRLSSSLFYAGSQDVVFAMDFSEALQIVTPPTDAVTHDTITDAIVGVSPSGLTVGIPGIIAGAAGAVSFLVSGGVALATFTLTTAGGATLVRPCNLKCV